MRYDLELTGHQAEALRAFINHALNFDMSSGADAILGRLGTQAAPLQRLTAGTFGSLSREEYTALCKLFAQYFGDFNTPHGNDEATGCLLRDIGHETYAALRSIDLC